MEKTARSITYTPDLPAKPAPHAGFSPGAWAKAPPDQREQMLADRRRALRVVVIDWMMDANAASPGTFSIFEQAIFSAISGHLGASGEVFPSLTRLGDMAGIKSRTTVGAAADGLEARGLVTRTKRPCKVGWGWDYSIPYIANDDPCAEFLINTPAGVVQEMNAPDLTVIVGKNSEEGVVQEMDIPSEGGTGNVPSTGEVVQEVDHPAKNAGKLAEKKPIKSRMVQEMDMNLTKQDSNLDLDSGGEGKGKEGGSASPPQHAAEVAPDGQQEAQAAPCKAKRSPEREFARLSKFSSKLCKMGWDEELREPVIRRAIERVGIDQVAQYLDSCEIKQFQFNSSLRKALDKLGCETEGGCVAQEHGTAPAPAVAAIEPLGEGATVAEKQAREVLVKIRASIGAAAFNSWFATTRVEVGEKDIAFYVASDFIQSRLNSSYLADIKWAMKGVGLDGLRIEILVGSGVGASPTLAPAVEAAEVKPAPALAHAAPVVEAGVTEGRVAECSEDEMLWEEALSSISEAPKAVKTLRIIGRRGMTVVLQASSVQHQRAVEAAFADIIADAWTGVLGDRPWIRVLAPGDEVDLVAA